MVQGRARPVLNFCSNNYLGLADHPAVISAAQSALDTHGNGLGSVRFICGTQDIHKKLERNIADFHSMDDSILYESPHPHPPPRPSPPPPSLSRACANY